MTRCVDCGVLAAAASAQSVLVRCSCGLPLYHCETCAVVAPRVRSAGVALLRIVTLDAYFDQCSQQEPIVIAAEPASVFRTLAIVLFGTFNTVITGLESRFPASGRLAPLLYLVNELEHVLEGSGFSPVFGNEPLAFGLQNGLSPGLLLGSTDIEFE